MRAVDVVTGGIGDGGVDRRDLTGIALRGKHGLQREGAAVGILKLRRELRSAVRLNR